MMDPAAPVMTSQSDCVVETATMKSNCQGKGICVIGKGMTRIGQGIVIDKGLPCGATILDLT